MKILRRYAVLDTAPEAALDDLTAMAAQLCQTPIATITLVDEQRQWFKSKLGMELPETPRDHSFCAHLIDHPELLVVPDATRDPRFADNPMVTKEEGIRFYAGAPLISPEGAMLGALCVIDHVPRELTGAQQEALVILSRQVMTQFELHRRTRELQMSEEKLRAIIDAAPECVKLLDADGTLREMNPAGVRLIGAGSFDEVDGCNLLPLVAPEHRVAAQVMLAAAAAGKKGELQFRITGYQGRELWLEATAVPFYDESTGQDLVLSISHDITRRKQAEERLQRLNRLYAVSNSINEAIVRVKETCQLYETACRIAVERGGFVMAWVGLADAEQKFLRPAARWGRDEGYLDAIRISCSADDPTGRGPAGRAFRTGALACTPDIEADADTFATKTEALQRGYRSCAGFPLKIEGHPVGVLLVYGDRAGYFDDEVLQLLNALAENISFAAEAHLREERKLQAEDAVRSSEGRYRTLFQYAPDGILIAVPEGRYLDANASICRMLGYTREELIGRDASDIVAPQEIRRIGKALSVIKSGTDYYREWQFRRKDGSLFRAEVIATLMPDGNIMAMIRDITERQRMEARFRRLVDSNAQGVLFWNADGTITGANDAFLRIVGHTHEELDAGQLKLAEITPPEYAELDRRNMEEMARTGFCALAEKELLRKDGSRVPVLVGAAAFEDNPREGVCFVLDITERKTLEQQFLRSQRMESIGTLAGGIAHDLNNVLGPVILSLDLLRLKFTDPASLELISVISDSALRGAAMVKQVLSFARGVEGRRVDLQIKHVIRDIEKIVNETFLKNIQVTASIPNDLWTVLGDPTQIHQVLLNLCVNARDAMSEGGKLTLGAENVTIDAHYAALHSEARPGPYVLLEVEDSGAGIPPEIIEKIFDPFFTTKEIGKGTGLGLSTTLAIVKSHGGFMRVYSELGGGTRFKVYLPAQTEVSPEAAAAAEAQLPRGHGELIMVVDDEASVRQITQQTLEAFGYRVVLASDGVEAVAIFAEQGPGIAAVLTDMMMPVMDGPATIQVLRRMNPRLPIIAASGLAANSSVAHVASLDVKHFLPKPYTAEALLTTLRLVLGGNPRPP